MNIMAKINYLKMYNVNILNHAKTHFVSQRATVTQAQLTRFLTRLFRLHLDKMFTISMAKASAIWLINSHIDKVF